VSYH